MWTPRALPLHEVNGGLATVDGNLTVSPGSVLLAAFALNDITGHGKSRLSVGHDLIVEDGGSALVGCEPGFFTCLDDPNPTSPTLFIHDRVGRDVIGDEPLGIIIHSSLIEGNVNEHGGGGGFNCTPTGVFTLFGSPVFSDYEDNRINGSVTIRDITSCYLGIARNHVAGDVRVLNTRYADPDAIEITTNHIAGDLVCRGNISVWDSSETSSGSIFPRDPKPNWAVVSGSDSACSPARRRSTVTRVPVPSEQPISCRATRGPSASRTRELAEPVERRGAACGRG